VRDRGVVREGKYEASGGKENKHAASGVSRAVVANTKFGIFFQLKDHAISVELAHFSDSPETHTVIEA